MPPASLNGLFEPEKPQSTPALAAAMNEASLDMDTACQIGSVGAEVSVKVRPPSALMKIPPCVVTAVAAATCPFPLKETAVH